MPGHGFGEGGAFAKERGVVGFAAGEDFEVCGAGLRSVRVSLEDMVVFFVGSEVIFTSANCSILASRSFSSAMEVMMLS